MNISGLRPRLAALLTAILICVGLLSLSTAPAWAAAGTITEFPTNGASFGITAGPDGIVWFTQSVGEIGRITTTGTVTASTNSSCHRRRTHPDTRCQDCGSIVASGS